MAIKLQVCQKHAWPVLICDNCGQPIKGAPDGVCLWRKPDAEGEELEMFTVHHGACQETVEQRIGSQVNRSEAVPLDAVIAELSSMLRINWPVAEAAAAKFWSPDIAKET